MKKFDKIFKKRLEKILIDGGLINNEIAEHVRSVEAETGKLIGEVLVEEGYVSEEDIARELSRNLQLPYLTLANYNISKKLVEQLPAELLHKHQVIPVDRFGDTMSVAMSQHLTLEGFKEVREKADGDVTFFVSLISQVKDLLKEFAPVDEGKLEALRKKKTERQKPSSWTDIFDTANKSVSGSAGGGRKAETACRGAGYLRHGEHEGDAEPDAQGQGGEGGEKGREAGAQETQAEGGRCAGHLRHGPEEARHAEAG